MLNKLKFALTGKSQGGLIIGGNFANKPFLEKIQILSDHLKKIKEKRDAEKKQEVTIKETNDAQINQQ